MNIILRIKYLILTVLLFCITGLTYSQDNCDTDKELELYRTLAEHCKEELGADSPAYIWYALQYTHRLVSAKYDYADAVNYLDYIDDILDKHINSPIEYSCNYYMTYAKYEQILGNQKKAKQYVQKALTAYHNGDNKHVKLEDITTLMSSLDMDEGSERGFAALYNSSNPEKLYNIIERATVLKNHGHISEAIELLLIAEEKAKKNNANGNDIFHIYEGLSMCYGVTDLENAEKYYSFASKYMEYGDIVQQLQHKLNRIYLISEPYEQFRVLSEVKVEYERCGIFDFVLNLQILRGFGYYFYNALDYKKSIDYYTQALELCTNLGKNNSLRTDILYLLCLCYRASYNFEQAYKLSSELWNIHKEIDEYSDKWATSLSLHIEDCINCNKLDEALELLKKYQRFFPNELSRIFRAKYAIKKGDYDMAEVLLQNLVLSTSMSIKEQSYVELEHLYGDMGCDKISIPLCFNNNRFRQDIIEHLHFMTPMERKRILVSCSQKINTLIKYVPINQICINEALNFSLFSKGLLYHTSSEIRKMLGSNHQAYGQYTDLVKRKEQLNIFKTNGDSVNVAILSKEVDSLERELTTHLVSLKKLQQQLNISSNDVLNKISKKDLAIDFVRYNMNDSAMYGAFVFSTKLKEAGFIPLFDEVALTNLLNQIYTKNGHKYYQFYMDKAAKGASYNFFWSKLEPYFKGYDNIYFSGDGLLNQLAIELLPDENDKPLNQKYRIHRVFHLADIKGDCSIGNDFLAIGVSDYNTPAASEAAIDRGSWTNLPNVSLEFQTIQNQITANSPDIRYKFVLDDMAREEYVKSLNGSSVSTLHFATHGFYKSNNDLMRAQENKNDDDHNIAVRALKANQNSISGLILRTGNTSWKSPENTADTDDILMSEEVENLDFPNLNLTVLSACETGLGDVDSDGVWGLQRAFRIAGSKSLLCSLCKVDDDYTAMFMGVFYENASQGKTIYESYRAAQKFLFDETYTSEDGVSLWPSFILIE